MTDLPLSGVSVVDAGGETTAYCAKLLFDLGASVTVLEPPEGHVLRRRSPFDERLPRRSLVFDWYHGGSLTLEVSADDLTALTALAADADVILVAPGHSPWPAAEDRPSWVPSSCIVCSITPFGRGGPYETWKATHLVSVAVAGGVHRYGPLDGPPVAPPPSIHWDFAGAHGALAVLAALRSRDWAGPQEIDVSAQELETTLDYFFERYAVAGAPLEIRSIPVGIPPTGIWRCADGMVEISAHQPRHWDLFLELLGHPEELSEPVLGDTAIRRELTEGLIPIIDRLIAPHRRHELFARAQALGLPSSVLNTPAQFVADEQLVARGSIVEQEIAGRPLRQPASPLRANIKLSRDTPGVSDAEVNPTLAAATKPAPAVVGAPLSDLRVLSFGAFYAGNAAASLLAGLGAEVAKVESPAQPEVIRTPAYGFERRTYVEPSGVPTTPMFASLARGTRNLAIDPKHPEGRDVLRRLVQQVDVVIENFGVGTMERWGLGFDELASLNPRLVMLSMTGFGRSGPRSGYRAYAANISAFCGMTRLHASQSQLSDAATAVHGAIAAVAAIDHARRLGRAIHLDISHIEVMASLLAPSLLDPLVNGVDTARTDGSARESVFAGIFPCLGVDSWVALEVGDQDELRALTELVERPDLGAVTACGGDSSDLHDAVRSWTAGLTHRSAALLLQRAGVPAGPVSSHEDVVHDPQLRHRRFPRRVIHPDLGPVDYPGVLHHLSVTEAVPSPPAERLGASTEELLRQWLCLDTETIGALERAGVIARGQRG